MSDSQITATTATRTRMEETVDENAREEMAGVLLDLLKRIVGKPEAASVSFRQGPGTTVYSLSVDPSDFGRLLGKSGATVESLRTLTKVIMAVRGIRAVLEISEELEIRCLNK